MKQLLIFNLLTGLIIIIFVLLRNTTSRGGYDWLFILSTLLIPVSCNVLPLWGGYEARKSRWIKLRSSFFSILGITFGISFLIFDTIDTIGGGPRVYFPIWPKIIGLSGTFLVMIVFVGIPLYILFLLGWYLRGRQEKTADNQILANDVSLCRIQPVDTTNL